MADINHKFSNAIIKMCSSLKRFEITYFNHIRIFHNGNRISLGNRPDWLAHFAKNNYQAVGNFSKNAQNLTPGYILWNSIPSEIVLNDAKKNFDIDNGITIIKKYHYFTDMYLFASTPNNIQINNFYINNFSILNHFISYYEDKASKIITPCLSKMPLVDNNQSNNTTLIKSINADDIHQFFADTQIKKYRFEINNKMISLSAREYECIKLLARGKSSKEIAAILSLSPKTIYFYFNNIKDKVNCYTKSELLELVSGLLS